MTLEPAQRRGRGPAGDQQLRAAVGGDRTNGREPVQRPPCPVRRPRLPTRLQTDRAAPGRADRRGRTTAASVAAGRPRDSRRPPRASAAGRCRRAGRGSRAATRHRAIATTSAEYRLLARAARSSLAATATNARRSAAVASGMAPEPRTTRPPGVPSRSTSRRRRSPNERSSGGPDTISTSAAPAARNPRRWCSATRDRASASRRVNGPAPVPGSGCRIRTDDRGHRDRV